MQVAHHGLFNKVCQGHTSQSIVCISTGSIQLVGVIEEVTALGGAALFHNLLKAFTVPD
jgi:hypothetical protein